MKSVLANEHRAAPPVNTVQLNKIIAEKRRPTVEEVLQLYSRPYWRALTNDESKITLHKVVHKIVVDAVSEETELEGFVNDQREKESKGRESHIERFLDCVEE
jgi:hypothetical protein